MDEPILDCLIVGGGPAGLTAAIYLARFHLDIMVVDAGKSRASWIPCTRNVSGFPDGIEGTELLERMRQQVCKYGAKMETEFVTKLERDAETGLFPHSLKPKGRYWSYGDVGSDLLCFTSM